MPAFRSAAPPALFTTRITRRTLLGTTGLTGLGALWLTSRGTSAQTSGPVLHIAAANATSSEKTSAQYRCDGTNDYAEFKTALAALPASGGTLSLSSGTFNFGASNVKIEHRPNILIVGQGIDVTFVQNSPPNTADLEPFSYSDADGAVVRDLTLSSTPNGRLTSDALDFDNCDNVLVERVKITASPGRGIVFDGKDQPGQAGWQAINNVVRTCEITGCMRSGIELLCADFCLIENCVAYGNGESGVNLAPQSDTLRHARSNTISGGTFSGNTKYGIAITAGVGNTVTGVRCLSNGQSGILITAYGSTTRKASANTVSGGEFSGNAVHGVYISESDTTTVSGASCANNGGDGIRIQTKSTTSNAANGTQIRNCVCTDTQGTKTQDYGVNLFGAPETDISGTVIRDNDLRGNRVGAYKLIAVNTDLGGNLGEATPTKTATATSTPTTTPTSTATPGTTAAPTETPVAISTPQPQSTVTETPAPTNTSAPPTTAPPPPTATPTASGPATFTFEILSPTPPPSGGTVDIRVTLTSGSVPVTVNHRSTKTAVAVETPDRSTFTAVGEAQIVTLHDQTGASDPGGSVRLQAVVNNVVVGQSASITFPAG